MMDSEKPLGATAEPFAWTDGVSWHKPAHRAVMASVALGAWMSAALDDPNVCEAMKADIREWFSAGEPMEILCQALSHFAPTPLDELQTLGQQYDQPTTFTRFLTQEEQLCKLEAWIDDCADQGAFGGRGV